MACSSSVSDNCFSNDVMNAPNCTICFEAVIDNVGRSITKLQCGHYFHTDCIGSEFNKKGEMKCPNCRKIENGKWMRFIGSENEDHGEGVNLGDDNTYSTIRARLEELFTESIARMRTTRREYFDSSRMYLASGLPIHGAVNNVGNPNLLHINENMQGRMPYFHQQQFPLHNCSPHPTRMAYMMARRRHMSAPIPLAPVGAIPVSYQPRPPYPEQPHYPLMSSHDLSLETGTITSARGEEHQIPAYHHHYGFGSFRRN